LKNIKLIVKTQEFRKSLGIELIEDDRVIVINKDMNEQDYITLMSSCHVCLAPRKWEGLGLLLSKAVSVGLPVISSNIPPINEVIIDGFNGLLVDVRKDGAAPSGIMKSKPNFRHISRSIEEIAGEEKLIEMNLNTIKRRNELSWDYTIQDVEKIITGT
jgi:glycosyltransferase involved in cell wall biosynthesis